MIRTAAKLDSLAMWTATGGAAANWAKDNGVSIRATYEWLKLDEVRERVDLIRGRLIDEGLGKLVGTVRKAVSRIDHLVDSATTDVVKLSASRAVLAEVVTLKTFTDLERRVAALESGGANVVAERTDEPSLPA
jgi:hypothetical protein